VEFVITFPGMETISRSIGRYDRVSKVWRNRHCNDSVWITFRWISK
jgi:hypothetical protein